MEKSVLNFIASNLYLVMPSSVISYNSAAVVDLGRVIQVKFFNLGHVNQCYVIVIFYLSSPVNIN